MPKLSRRQLIAYAVVSQHIGGSNDILTGLMPFFDPIIAELSGQLFDPEEFSRKVTELYDWPFNPDVSQELIPRLVSQGRLSPVAADGDRGAYMYCNVSDPDIQQLEISAEENLREIANHFQNFCEELSPLSFRDHTIEELEEILLNWMVAVEGFDRVAIGDAVDKLLNTEEQDEGSGVEERDDNGIFVRPTLNTDESYLCARFVEYISNTNEAHFYSLMDIASVALLTEVVLDVRNPPDASRKEPDFVVFLDAPLLMDAMGLSGKHSKDRIGDIISGLGRLQAKIWIFEHSCMEVRRNLRRMFELSPHERYGPTAEAIRKGEVLEAFAREVMEDVAGYVTQLLGFPIVRQSLDDYPNFHRYFDNELFEEFAARATWHEHPEPRTVDAMSVTLLLRRRRDTHSRDPLKVKFLMVSRNRLYADFARRFCIEHDLLSDVEVGPIIHQRRMAAMIMLTLGYQGRREFTRRQVLGSCERVLRMRPQVARTALRTIREVKPEVLPQFEALLTRPRSAQVLADKTLNVDRVINNDNVLELLDLMEGSLAEKHKAQAEEKISQIQTTHKRKEDKLKSQIQELGVELEVRDDTIKDHDQKLTKASDLDKQTLEGWVRVAKRAETNAMRVEFGVFFGLALLFLVLQINVSWLGAGNWGWIGAVLSFLFALMSLRKGLPNVLHRVVVMWRDRVLQQRIEEAGRGDLIQRFDIDWESGTVSEKVARNTSPKTDLLG